MPFQEQSFTLLVVDDIHPVFFDIVQAEGLTIDYRPEISYDEAASIIENYQGLVVRSKFKVDATLIDRAKQLRIIARAGAGVDNIDVAYSKAKQIKLISAPEGNCDAVAEHMIGMLLMLMNKLRTGDAEVREGLWLREENRGMELGGKTVGLIGYGNNGKAMARKLHGFDVEVLAYDKYNFGFSDDFAREADMEEIFDKADALSFHIPLTPETFRLVDTDFLSRFRKPILFLNGSRGEIVDMEAVLVALEGKRIVGAAFDVLPVEKFPALALTDWYKRLVDAPNVVLSPHVAGWTVESYFKIAKVLGEKLVEVLKE